MAWTSEALRRRLESSTNPTYTKQPIQDTAVSKPAPIYTSQPIQTTSANPTYNKQPISATTQATYAPGEGSEINYGEQRYDNGVQASPVIGQADLPKYENVDQFDFNRNYEDTLDQLQRQRADLQQQNDLTTQRLQEDYARKFRDIRQQQQDAINLQNEQMAGRGILRSGLAVKEAGNIGNQFGGLLDEQQRALSAALEDQTGQYSQAERQIQEQIGRAQEYLTRQQQMLEEQRARQAAAAAAAQRGAWETGNVAEQKRPELNVVKDNLGKYFIVNPTAKTRQQVDQSQLGSLNEMYRVNTIDSLAGAANLLGGEQYINNANALARRLGGNLNGAATLDTRLGFRDLGMWGQ